LGDFDSARQYAMRGLEMWRSGGVQFQVEEVSTPPVGCLCNEGLIEWHFCELALCHETMAEAIAVAKELNSTHGLAVALGHAAVLGYCERNPVKVERLASDLIELSTRQSFEIWLAVGEVHCGWARSLADGITEGVARIEDVIRDYRANCSMMLSPLFLALKAEALYFSDGTSEALKAIREAEALAEEREERWWSAELHRLRGVFLAALSAEETQIEASFHEAIRVAKEQKSVSLEKRAEATYAEYRRQKASGSAGRGLRLPF
jgi:adenylate cyclase